MSKNTNHPKKGHKKAVEKEQLAVEVVEKEPEDTLVPTEATVEPTEQPAVHLVESETPIEIESTPKDVEPQEAEPVTGSVIAQTHSKTKPKKEKGSAAKLNHISKRVPRFVGLGIGLLAVLTLLTSGILSQYFKGKTLPNVSVAGVSSSAETPEALKSQLQKQVKGLKITLQTEGKKIEPKFEEIGFQIDVDKTVTNALNAKRQSGVLGKLAFWHRVNVPAVVVVNDTLLNQFLESRAPELSKPPQDAQLQFSTQTNTFIISDQADGQGANTKKLTDQLNAVSHDLSSKTLQVGIAKKGPTITVAKLQPLVEPANELVSRRIVLTGLGYIYQARPADIASWVTPTPKDNGEVKLVIDPAKIQSYVDGLGKKISNAPVDKKVLKDEASGTEVILQEGHDGTELSDKSVLADAIAQSLKNGQDITQTMNIKVAAYQTVNMNAYDKWIEVDLSEQRTTAYEKATPVKNFLIASGVRGHETVTGEFSIWLKVRSQTMQGGSKADGSFYNIPNVEWVSYFYQDYALHGAWWRKQFGSPASHGCVNMTNADAQWVYEWAPLGTKVIVHA